MPRLRQRVEYRAAADVVRAAFDRKSAQFGVPEEAGCCGDVFLEELILECLAKDPESRYQAMGGTGVAFANDSAAIHWNPANLAYKRGYDFQLPATLNANIENRALEKLSSLIQTYDELAATIDGIRDGTTGQLNEATAGQVFSFLEDLSAFGGGGENVHFGIDIGLMGRVHNFGYSAQSLTTGTVFADVDLTNLGLLGGGATLDGLIPPGITTPPPTNPTFIAFRDRVESEAGWTQQQANFAAAAAEQAGIDVGNSAVANLLVLAASATGSGANSLADNNSGAVVAGLSTQEFAFTYSHTIPVPFQSKMGDTLRMITQYVHNRFALGANAKYMLGITFAKAVRYDAGQSGGDLLGDLADFGDNELSHAFGLDLGVGYRPTRWLQFGMVARNVNSPTFDLPDLGFASGESIDEIEIKPQVRVGVALLPIRHLTLAFDIDATENEIATLPGFKSRIISVGGEYEIPFGKSVGLALRVGGYNNIAPEVEGDWAMTGGIGLRLWQFVLDASAGGSFEKERIQTDADSYIELPTRLNAGLTLKWEKSL